MDKWDSRFIEMAKLVSSWSSCHRDGRQVGAVIVKDKRILTTGYNGAPSGVFNCRDKGVCATKGALNRVLVKSCAMPFTPNKTQLFKPQNRA